MITFNQSNTYVAIATLKGYHVFSVDPFQQRVHRFFLVNQDDSNHGAQDANTNASRIASRYYGIGAIEMLFRSNILAMIGGGPNPAFGTRNKVVVWDNQQMQMIGEINMASPVLAVRMNRNIICAVLESRVHLFNNELREVEVFETAPNPRGIVALSVDTENMVLAFPFVNTGIVRCIMLNTEGTRYIKAHSSEISCIALNRDGSRLATASEKGTLIRIFDTATGDQLKEVRRGSSHAKIWSIAFSNDNRYLCSVASSGSVHLFDIRTTAPNNSHQLQDEKNAPNRTSSLSMLAMVGMEWAQSEWSFAGYKDPIFAESECRCAFGSSNKQVRILTRSGYMFELTFDLAAGGEPVSVVKKSFLPTLQAED